MEDLQHFDLCPKCLNYSLDYIVLEDGYEYDYCLNCKGVRSFEDGEN